MLKHARSQSEPIFARGQDGRMYRLQYRGMYRWAFHASGPDGVWELLLPKTFDSLMHWGWAMRHAGDPQLPRDLGIRLTGKRTHRHSMLGCHARCLGLDNRTEGEGVSASTVFTAVHAELAFDGSILVYAQRFKSSDAIPGFEPDVVQRSGLWTRKSIEAWLKDTGVWFPGINYDLVEELRERVRNEQESLDRVAELG